MLTRREAYVKALKENTPGLVYLKLSKDAKSLLTLNYDGKQVVNVVDIFEIRKRLMLLKNLERVDFLSLFGSNFLEHRFSAEDEIDFHSNFESGNLRTAVKLENGVYCLEVSPDTNSVGHYNWFHFCVTGAKKGQEVTFRVCNMTKAKSLMETVCVSSHRQYKKQKTEPGNPKDPVAAERRDYGRSWTNQAIVTDFFKNEDNPVVDCTC